MKESEPQWIKVLRHLARFDPESMTYIAPVGVEQQGIADAVGITRANAALVLNRMKQRGFVESRLLHIVGHNKRKKAYVLTQAGFVVWRELKAHS